MEILSSITYPSNMKPYWIRFTIGGDWIEYEEDSASPAFSLLYILIKVPFMILEEEHVLYHAI